MKKKLKTEKKGKWNEEGYSRTVVCGKDENSIIEAGIEAIALVLNGTDMIKKEQLLLCLDTYLDPWFGHKLPYAKDIFDLCEHLIISENIFEVKMDALRLLIECDNPPYPIIEANLDKIEREFLPYVLAEINNPC